MRAALTGAAGYLGSAMLRSPDAAGDDLLAFDRRPLRVSHPSLRFLQQDIHAPLAEHLRAHRTEVLIHLAFVLDPMHDARAQRQINVGGLLKVLAAAAEAEVPHVVVLSSATAYGAHDDNPEWLAEDAPLRATPAFPYAHEKREVEELCAQWARENPGARLSLVRPCVIFGPGVDNFISRFTTRPVVPLVLGRDPPMQLVHEDDAARAVWFIARRPAGGLRPGAPEAFNVAADGLLTYGDVSRVLGGRVIRLPSPLVRAVVGAAWRLRLRAVTEAPPGMVPFIEHRWCIDNRRLKQEGFRYLHDARQTLEAFLAGRRAR